MKVVGLVSGGKDSIYALLHAAALGHEVVAIANLRPHDDTVQELDSHMLQTVGHNVVQGMAECMGVPLFFRRTAGKAVSAGLGYDSTTATAGDETEDLAALLQGVRQALPEVQGVASGAIRSNYQRLRVEAVCLRLGFTSLAWLWERKEERLFHDFCLDGVRCVLLKVSTIGLSRKHVGMPLEDVAEHLMGLVRGLVRAVCCSISAPRRHPLLAECQV